MWSLTQNESLSEGRKVAVNILLSTSLYSMWVLGVWKKMKIIWIGFVRSVYGKTRRERGYYKCAGWIAKNTPRWFGQIQKINMDKITKTTYESTMKELREKGYIFCVLKNSLVMRRDSKSDVQTKVDSPWSGFQVATMYSPQDISSSSPSIYFPH